MNHNKQMKDVAAEVIYNKQVSRSYYQLALRTGWGRFQPGQFVMILVPDKAVFVRRPFSISRSIDNGTIEVCYKTVGVGTRRIACLEPGQRLPLLGPLGNGFDIPKGSKSAVIVAGGFGIAPFVEMTKRLASKKIETTLFYGGKVMEDILFIDQFEGLGVKCHIATEDGSLGYKGKVTELLLESQSNLLKNSIVYCCGPKGLIAAMVDISRKKSLRAQMSYETYMGCGIGVCLGCAVPTKDGYKRACTEGPVFSVDDLMGDVYVGK